jgi:phosphatidylserine synthase 2
MTRAEREIEEERDPLKSDEDPQPMSDANADVDASSRATNAENTAANTVANSGKGKQKRPGLIRRGTKRVFKQFSPHDFTAFEWGGTTSFTAYFTVVLLLSLFLAAELNPFYLKYLLWMEPSHPIIILRLIGIFLCGLPAVRELYTYMNDSRYVSS